MIKYSDNARDYIQRTKRARDYLYKNELARESKEEQEQVKKSGAMITGLLMTFLTIIICIILMALPRALDQMWERGYEQPSNSQHIID